ncbi:hypothetical protein C4J81_13970 [Deltaproteobacteria bacterium Smac51]|nr:hypothetical protein C4J81_13970 [Deltaproteobacteria bacterium Smac51]
MKIKCFPITMDKTQALKIAEGRGNLLGRLLLGGKKISLRVMYLESRYLTYEMTYADNPLVSLFKKDGRVDRQKIRVMVEGTTCSAAYAPDNLNFVEKEVAENDIQLTYYDDQRLTDAGGIMAKRMVRRRVGRSLTIRPLEMEKIFRPFYIAIYGDMVEGTKVRYLPIAADGNDVTRCL